MAAGETPFTYAVDQLAPYVLPMSQELDMVFQFQLMHIDAPHSGGSDGEIFKHIRLVWMEWSMSEMKTVVEKWQACKRDEGFWNAYDGTRIFVSFVRLTRVFSPVFSSRIMIRQGRFRGSEMIRTSGVLSLPRCSPSSRSLKQVPCMSTKGKRLG